METGDPKRDIAALFLLVERMQGRMDEVFRRLYSDPGLPGSHGDIPALLEQQRIVNLRCIEHTRCLTENHQAIVDLRKERKRWLRNARLVVWAAGILGGGSAAWTGIREFLLGK